MLDVKVALPPVAVNPFEVQFIKRSEQMAERQQLWGFSQEPAPPGSTPMSWSPLWTQVKGKPPTEAQVIIKDYIDALMGAAKTPRQRMLVEDAQAHFEAIVGGRTTPLSQSEVDALVKKIDEAISYAWGDRATAPLPANGGMRTLFTGPVAKYLVGLGLLGAVAGLVWWQQR